MARSAKRTPSPSSLRSRASSPRRSSWATAARRSASIVGITYRQLDYWARTDLVRPSLADARGSGTQRRYSYRDLVELKVIKSLLDAGVTLQTARTAIEYLRDDLGDDWATASLVLNGTARCSRAPTTQFDRPRAPRPGRAEHRAARLGGATSSTRASTSCERTTTMAPRMTTPVDADRGEPRGRRGAELIDGAAAARAGARSRTTPSGSSRSCSTSTASRGSTSRARSCSSRDRDGNPVQAFTPDFYLPAYDLYIEITTLNQKLVTKKNRKARRLQELLPRVSSQGPLPARLPRTCS